jgi:putative RNA 2'-phosphotransferase
VSAIHRCSAHGPFDAGESGNAGDGDRCPICGERGDRLLDGERRVQLSKFLSGALRHFPEDAGLTLTERGWATYGRVLDATTERYPWTDREVLDAVIETDPKGRFERERASGGEGGNENENGRENERIRAAYGHSVDVALGDSEDETARSIPDRLYHGTAPRNRDAIAGEGLVPMGRREVHLSGSLEAAREVGTRHAADPIVFAVDAHELIESGHRVTKRGRGIYATDRVPPEFLAECDRDA